MATTTPDRILTLDVIRGVAVMGIFSVNVIAMAMIESAYSYPPAYGFHSFADRLIWLLNLTFIDGKMRALFSMLFGASMLLVVERAVAAGRSGWRTHYARMVVLMIFGLLHFVLLWWGDILTHYAAVGMVAFLAHRLAPEKLLSLSATGFLIFAAASIAGTVEGYRLAPKLESSTPSAELRPAVEQARELLHPSRARIAADKAQHASVVAHARAAIPKRLADPFDFGPLWFETLALMLLGMAALRTGYLTGEWGDPAYKRIAAVTLGGGWAIYAALGIFVWSRGFSPPDTRMAYGGVTTLIRPLMALGYAALFILLFRRASWLRARIAAVGRAAFTNYIGSTLVGTAVFFGTGLGLYGTVSRAQAWLLVPIVWGLMLLWSKPWLDRFNYGPFEWAWRSLARGEIQPMLKNGGAAAIVAA